MNMADFLPENQFLNELSVFNSLVHTLRTVPLPCLVYTEAVHRLSHNYTPKNESENLPNQRHKTLKRYLAQSTQWRMR